MKTIEILIGGHKAQFTTKSLTLGGRELLYANMSQISHDPENHIYRFTYDGRKIALPYEAKDARVMTAIFTQVQALEAQKMSWTQALSGIHPNENPQPAAGEKTAAPATAAPVPEEKPAEAASAQQADERKDEAISAQHEAGFNVKAQVEGQESQSSENTSDNANAQLSESAEASEASGSETSAKEEQPKKSFKGRFASKKKEKAEASADAKDSDVKPEEKEPADPEKKKKLKKSLKIFAIIIAAVIAMSAIYYFVFGTADSPSEANPNNTESQQYEDIDELIDDMQ